MYGYDPIEAARIYSEIQVNNMIQTGLWVILCLGLYAVARALAQLGKHDKD